MFKIIPSGKIDWTGFKSWLIHGGILAGATLCAYILASLKHYNFGEYQGVAMFTIAWVGDFLKKFFEEYHVPMTVNPEDY